MARDYAKKKKQPAKKTRRGASRQKKKQDVSPGLWLFAFALVTSLTCGLVYLKWYKPDKANITTQKKSPVNKKSHSDNNKITKKNRENEVPFYKVHEDLTNKTVEIPKEDLKLPEHYKKRFYTMPCGAFREKSRAEELKARIALAGSKSDLKAVNSKGSTWYRIQLGPFNSKRSAEKIRHRLQRNNIHDCNIIPHMKPGK